MILPKNSMISNKSPFDWKPSLITNVWSKNQKPEKSGEMLNPGCSKCR